jgi:MPBQ/MSBQ methyltransferase
LAEIGRSGSVVDCAAGFVTTRALRHYALGELSEIQRGHLPTDRFQVTETGDDTSFPSVQEREAIRSYLNRLYTGVFNQGQIERHLKEYVGFEFAEMVTPLVVAHAQPGDRVLDVGSGFGSFVLRSRESGLDAFGVELAPFEVEFARKRLRRLRPEDDPQQVYLLGDVMTLELPRESVDVVTFWNVMEHIGDHKSLLEATRHFLRPGGSLYIICPNYAAFRQEAHYHVPWYPLFPRKWAARYLRRLGRDAHYFETSVHYRTNWGVLWTLNRLGFEVYDLSNTVSMALKRRNLREAIRNAGVFLRFYNPFIESVVLAARRK